MTRFRTRLDHFLLSSILLLTLISSGNALPQVANYPRPVVARPPGRVVQKESGGPSWVKFINEHRLPLAVAGVVVVSILVCLCCSCCCCCGRGSRRRHGGESDQELERKHVSAQQQFFDTAFGPFRWFRNHGLRNKSGFC